MGSVPNCDGNGNGKLDIVTTGGGVHAVVTIEFFTVCTKLAEIAILYSKDLTTAKKSYLKWGST